MTAGPRRARDAGRLRDAAARLLRANWHEGRTPNGTEYGYTRPDPAKYPDQFFWDSCLHAVAWSHIDPSRARRELRTLAAAQRPDGLIGHTVFWDGRVRLQRAFSYNLVRRSDRVDGHDPAAAARVGLGRGGRPLARRPGLPPRRGCRRCAASTPGSTASGATATACSGSSSPTSRGSTPRRPTTRPLGPRAHPHPGFLLLLRFNRRRRFSYRRAVADGGFHAVDPLVNAAWALAWEGMARLGEPGAAERAERITAALVARLWDPAGDLPPARAGRRAAGASSTWAGLAPLALPRLPEEIARRLARSTCWTRAGYWLPFPVPSVSAQEPSFRPRRHRVAAPPLLARADLALRDPLRARRACCAPGGRPRRATSRGARPRWCCARASASTTTRSDRARPGGARLRGERDRARLPPARGGPLPLTRPRRGEGRAAD